MRWGLVLLVLLAGCSTAPIADLMDYAWPARSPGTAETLPPVIPPPSEALPAPVPPSIPPSVFPP
ncbi:MAG: hypothetical protein RMI91_01435 [Gemmatales bacterium]|nr:hypothetical protein [Gemmatales bacterium]MDW7993292.1 hypothetical protein [Gemmatales bacterium]